VVLEALKPNQLDVFSCEALALRGRHPVQPRAKFNVALHRKPWKERVRLEHHAAISPRPCDAPAVQQHTARRRRDQAGDHPQQRRLAAATGAYNADELAIADLQR
jgi:hypothetical protein